MTKIHPYLFFNGQCRAAFEFYAKCLDGEIVAMMTNAEMPWAAETPEERLRNIVHARMIGGDGVLMGGDDPSGQSEKSSGFAVALHCDDPTEAERAFGALSENGTLLMPIEETFWATRFGMLMDQFGIRWLVSCEK